MSAKNRGNLSHNGLDKESNEIRDIALMDPIY
jgi:hypothetical protein